MHYFSATICCNVTRKPTVALLADKKPKKTECRTNCCFVKMRTVCKLDAKAWQALGDNAYYAHEDCNRARQLISLKLCIYMGRKGREGGKASVHSNKAAIAIN